MSHTQRMQENVLLFARFIIYISQLKKKQENIFLARNQILLYIHLLYYYLLLGLANTVAVHNTTQVAEKCYDTL